MAITAQELNIILSAKDKNFAKAMNGAANRVEFFRKKAERATAKTGANFDNLGKAARRLAPLLAGVFSVRAISRMADSAAQIGILADIAGTSVTQFQKMSVASKTVGIEQEKLSDILKDVNDKVGDFLVTGAGPMADFFEKIAPLVGVTAENFRDLSAEDALQLYVDSLEKANVSQAEMVFFMEAIASDASALIPLLRDNGKEMQTLGDEAERAGRLLSEDAVTGARDLAEKFDELKDKTGTMIQQALLDNADDIIALVERMTDDVLPKVLAAASKVASFIVGSDGPGATVSDAQKALDAQGDAAFQASQDALEKQNRSRFMLDPATGEYIDVRDMDVPQEAAIRALMHGVDMGDEIGPGAYNPPQTSIRPRGRPSKSELANKDRAAKQFASDLKSAKDAYDSLLASLDPVNAAQLQYRTDLETINELERLSGEKVANKNELLGTLQVRLQRAKDEASGFADVTDTLEQGLTNAFMAGLDGAKSFEDAMLQTARAVIQQLYRVLVVQQMVNAAMGAFGFTPVQGGGFTRTGAGGRQMQAGTPVLTGESGREMFVPSTPGRLLSPVQTNRALAGGEAISVNQTINVTTGVQQTVRAEVMSMMPQIGEVAKAAVLDAKQRGGAFGRAL